MNHFDYLNSINLTKQDIMVDDICEKAYNSFMVNRGLSYFADTVVIANEMNRHHQTDNKLQYQFRISQSSRCSPWPHLPFFSNIKSKWRLSDNSSGMPYTQRKSRFTIHIVRQ